MGCLVLRQPQRDPPPPLVGKPRSGPQNLAVNAIKVGNLLHPQPLAPTGLLVLPYLVIHISQDSISVCWLGIMSTICMNIQFPPSGKQDWMTSL